MSNVLEDIHLTVKNALYNVIGMMLIPLGSLALFVLPLLIRYAYEYVKATFAVHS